MNNIKTQLTHHNNQRIVLFQLILLTLVAMNIMISCGNSSQINQINKTQIVSTQLADGEVVTAKTTQVNERSEEVIRSFVQKWLTLQLNWNTSDLKVEVDKDRIPGNVYAATFPLTTTNNFRSEYTKEIATLINQATKGSSIQSAVSIDYISEKPIKIRDGVWEVTFVSTWVGFDAEKSKQVFQVPFNKKIRLIAVPVASKPTFQTPENITGIQQIINEINQYGLQITSVKSYDPQ
jgi:hypothetical protein